MANTTNRDYYKILGVTAKTPKNELKKKYRELANRSNHVSLAVLVWLAQGLWVVALL